MKRKMALLMAMVFALMCCFSSFAFAQEDAVTEEIVIEEAAEETPDETAEKDAEEEISAEDAFPEESAQEEETSEDAVLEEETDDEMTLNAIDSEVQDVAEAITEEMLTSDREPARAVTKNLDMSLSGDITLPEGVTVTFTSDNEEVIANDGTVVRAIGSDTDVKVIATVSKDGSDDAVKELNFTVLNMETALLYANSFYYPELLGKEVVNYDSGSNSIISDIPDLTYSGYGSASSTPNDVDTYLDSNPDGAGVRVTRLTGGGPAYLDCMTNVSAPEQKKITHSTILNISNWGSQVKRLDIEIYGETTRAVSMGKVEINYATNAITVVPTSGSNFERIHVAKRLNLNQDYKIDFVVDYENHKFEFLIDGENYFPDSEFGILTSFKPAVQKVNYYFFRSATGAEFTIKDTIVTGEFDLNDPQVALDMIDENCFTYTNAGKITENFELVLPANVKTLSDIYGMEVTLESNKSASIAIDGYSATVTKAEEKQDVILTVTISTADKTVSKEFPVKVHNLAATNMLEASEPVITEDGGNKVITTSVYCDNLKEGETEATVYLFAARKEKESGKIDAVAVDTAVLTMGATEELEATLPDGGDSYDYVVYVWDSFGSRKTIINQPPAEPADFVVKDTTSGTADLEWTKADDDRKAVASYNVYRDGNLVDTTTTTYYTAANLDFGDTYTFGVTTVDDSGLESEYMSEAEATAKEVPAIIYETTSEEAPDATQTTNSNIECSWAGGNTYLWTAPDEKDGLKCHRTTTYDRKNADGSIQKIYSFFHTKTPFSYIDDTVKNIAVEITYFDEKPASNKGAETIEVAYQGGSKSTKFMDTGYWRTVVFEIDNAKFTEAALENATRKYNIRYKSTTADSLYVRRTVVANAEKDYVRPAASIKMDGALILRDILVFREDGQAEYKDVDGTKCLYIESGNALEMDVETIASSKRNVKVEIKYLDEGTEKIYLNYSSETGEKMESIDRTGSGEWKTAIINLDDAMFNGSVSSNFGRTVDLKLSGDEGLKIMAVRVY